MLDKNKTKDIDVAMDAFLNTEKPKSDFSEMDCSSGTCIIKTDKGLLERMTKKIITEDGRQLLV
jgi:hypothetical protein